MTKASRSIKARRDVSLIVGSILLGIFFAKTNVLVPLLTMTKGTIVLSSLLAGAAFVSLFTAAPAAVILIELMIANSLFEVIVWATIGAGISDYIIFRFVSHSFSADLLFWLQRLFPGKRVQLLHSNFLRWLMPIVGAFIVASPLPDELGIALMGFSHISTAKFLFLSVFLNFLGIAAIGMIAVGLKPF